MTRARRRAAVALAVVGGLGLSTWLAFRSSPLPAPPPLVGELPSAHPPQELALLALHTGVTHRSAAFAYRGGSPLDARDFSMTALLVRHPRGDLLIDTGFGRHVDAHFRAMPAPFRAVTSLTSGCSARDQLDALGYDVRRLAGILLTHAHWDHVSGVADFPEVEVWVTPEERRFIDEGGALTATLRETPGVRYREIELRDGPTLGFPRSLDVWGDGSIVIVPAPGHTPGSVVVLLAEPGGRRHALLGDLVWQREGVTLREERPWPQRVLGDSSTPDTRASLSRVIALAARFPDVNLVPAHDPRGFAGLPTGGVSCARAGASSTPARLPSSPPSPRASGGT